MTRFKELARIQAAIKRREKGRGHRMKNGVRLFVFLIVVVVIRTEAQDEVPRIEVGVQYSAINILSSRVGCSGCKVYNHGVGGRFIANFNRALSFECEVDFFPDEGVGASDVEGGRVTAAFFGPKGGYRTRRVGVFGKIRPGFQTYGKVITSVASINPLQFTFGRRVNFALDMGGVAEYYATNRIALRFDIGDTRIRFGSRFTHFWGNNLQFATGLVFRF